MEDCKITELFNLRDESALREAELKYGGYCRTLALNILGDKGDAEETVSDALFHAWQAIPPAKPRLLGAFLAKITRNLALNRIERDCAVKRGSGELPLVLDELDYCIPSSHSTEEAVDLRQLTELINRFLAEQKAEYRTIFLKRYWYMYPISEIAAKTGFSESKIKAALMRTRNALKEFLDREDFNI